MEDFTRIKMKHVKLEYNKIFIRDGGAFVVRSIDLPLMDHFKVLVGVHPTVDTERYHAEIKDELNRSGVHISNVEVKKDTVFLRDGEPTYYIGLGNKGELTNYFLSAMKEFEVFDLPNELQASVYIHCDEYHQHTKVSCLTAQLSYKEISNNNKTCDNCDCVEQEMKRLGVNGVKSYPCLYKSDSDDLTAEKKRDFTFTVDEKQTLIKKIIGRKNEGIEPFDLAQYIRNVYSDTDMSAFARKIAIEFADWYAGSMDSALSFDQWAIRNPELFKNKKV